MRLSSSVSIKRPVLYIVYIIFLCDRHVETCIQIQIAKADAGLHRFSHVIET